MVYRSYSCKLDLQPVGWFLGYLITSPYTYYAIEGNNKLLDISLLLLFGGVFVFLIYKDVEKKISSMTLIFEKCKADNEDFENRIDEANTYIQNSEMDSVHKLMLLKILNP